jgi:molybdate transport system regulatory protein
MGARIKIKLQVLRDTDIALGPGKADLLDAIAREGSISAAARALGMSYRRAWMLVDVMNHAWQAPLVNAVPGARRGATLTDVGREVLADYRQVEVELSSVVTGTSALRLLARLTPASG